MWTKIGNRFINIDHITDTVMRDANLTVWLVSGNSVALSGEEAIKFQDFLEASAVFVDQAERDELPRLLRALEAAALDTIIKIDLAADGRINFRRDFADRLRDAIGMARLNLMRTED